jgi:hypothetical protein
MVKKHGNWGLLIKAFVGSLVIIGIGRLIKYFINIYVN